MKRRSFLKGAAASGVLSACAFRPGDRPGAAGAQVHSASQPHVARPDVDDRDGHHAPRLYIYDMLYGVDAQFRPRPQMAEGHTISDDNRTWRIRLRDGLKFHDGEPVRAQDCVPSIRRWAARDRRHRS